MKSKLGFLLKRINDTSYFKLVDFVSTIEHAMINGEKVYIVCDSKYKNRIFRQDEKSNLLFLNRAKLDAELINIIGKSKSREYYDVMKDYLIKNQEKYYQLNSLNELLVIKSESKIAELDKISDPEEELIKKENEIKKTDIGKLNEFIKERIIAQDEQIEKILTSLYKNKKIIDLNLDEDIITKLKDNILIYGSTGTGKTEILKLIAKKFDIPIVITDSTSLSETGYIGKSIIDVIKELYESANKNITLAEKGIIVFDEFDKLAEKNEDRTHVSRIGVQRSLLKLLEDSNFYFDNIKFNSSKLTIVAIGAFQNMERTDDINQDIVNYGIMRELLGRFSKTIEMNTLTKENFIDILKKSNTSPLVTYKILFDELNVNMNYDEEFIEYVANQAIAKNTGARSIKGIFDEIVSDALYDVFSSDVSSIDLFKPKTPKEKAYTLKKLK